jgi:signal transduction histidine kinase
VLGQPGLGDKLWAAGFVVGGQLEAWLGPSSGLRWQAAVPMLLATAPVAWRRRTPRIALALGLAGDLTLASMDAGIGIAAALATMFLEFSLGRELDLRRSWIGLPAAAGTAAFQVLGQGHPVEDIVFTSMLLGGPWLFGYALRNRAERLELATARAEQAEHHRDQMARAAAEAERTRIARELHDIVSHAISLIAIQTQVIRARLGPPHEAEAEDLRVVEATARQAMAELRRLFGVLHAGPDPVPLAPQPGLAQLRELVSRTSGTGLMVDLQIQGEPGVISSGLELTGYRIVQEALTNVIRHAEAAHANVAVRCTPEMLELSVEDDGHGPSPSPYAGGRGLVGIHERVSLYGGTLTTGAGTLGGFRLEARLPVDRRW